jgi:hypothetical protein
VADMPLRDVIAMLNSVGPAYAVDDLLAMPAARIEAVMAELTPAEITRLLNGSRVHRRAELLAAIGPVRGLAVLTRMPPHELVELISSLPLPVAVGVLRGMPPASSAALLLEIPTQRRSMLQEALGLGQPTMEAAVSTYYRAAEMSVARIATGTSRLDHTPGDLLAEVMGRPFQISIRFHGDAPYTGDDLRLVAGRVDWRRVMGMLVLTNATPADTIAGVIRELRHYGHAVDVVRWLNEADDGVMKRALVRLLT